MVGCGLNLVLSHFCGIEDYLEVDWSGSANGRLMRYHIEIKELITRILHKTRINHRAWSRIINIPIVLRE